MIDVDRIRLRRLELRLTQADLGKAIGQDQGYISKIGTGPGGWHDRSDAGADCTGACG